VTNSEQEHRCDTCGDAHDDDLTASLCCKRECKRCGAEIAPWEEPQTMRLVHCEVCVADYAIGADE
jgi:hypothetical protein